PLKKGSDPLAGLAIPARSVARERVRPLFQRAASFPPWESRMNRKALKDQLLKDSIGYLLVQFVDLHGAPKVKMVPRDALDDVSDAGAGFAGGGVWGMGQNAASHDRMARVDPASYTPLPWKPGLARFAADLYVDGQPHPFCPRVNLKRVLNDLRTQGYVFNV